MCGRKFSLEAGRIRTIVVVGPGGNTGLTQPSAVALNQIRSIDQRRLLKRIGTLDRATMRRVDDAIRISRGLIDLD